MAKQASKAANAADAEIQRLEQLIAARRELRNAEQQLEAENARHERIKALIENRHAAATAAVLEAMGS